MNSSPQFFYYFLWFLIFSSSVDFIMWYTCNKQLSSLKSFLINNTYESSFFNLVLNHFKINRLISNLVNYYHNHFKKTNHFGVARNCYWDNIHDSLLQPSATTQDMKASLLCAEARSCGRTQSANYETVTHVPRDPAILSSNISHSWIPSHPA